MIVGGAILVPVWAGAVLSFGRLVQLEFALYRDEWVKDGRPAGLMVFLPGASGLATTICTLKWVLRTPSWSAGDPQATKLVKRFRSLWLIWTTGLVLLFGSMAIF